MPTAFKITNGHWDETSSATEVTFEANITRWIDDPDDPAKPISQGSWKGKVTYPKAGVGARTLASVRADLIQAAKDDVKNAAIAKKTIS